MTSDTPTNGLPEPPRTHAAGAALAAAAVVGYTAVAAVALWICRDTDTNTKLLAVLIALVFFGMTLSSAAELIKEPAPPRSSTDDGADLETLRLMAAEGSLTGEQLEEAISDYFSTRRLRG